MLPNFIGIGVSRSGTTWLHHLLSIHPQVYVPFRRKELHYFDWNYDKGIGWYEKYFPNNEGSHQYISVGEITPSYFFCKDATERIAAMQSVKKLILMLRHPVDRLYSSFSWYKRHHNYKGSFDGFLKENPDFLENSKYSSHLKAYLDKFDSSNILVLIFEHSINDKSHAIESICSFLNVSPDDISANYTEKIVNEKTAVRFPSLFYFASKLRLKLRNMHLDCIVNTVNSIGIKKLLLGKKPFPALDKNFRKKLVLQYQDDIDEIESLLNVNLDIWRT